MWRPKRPGRKQSSIRLQDSRDRVDLGGLDRFIEGEWWEDGRYAFGEHGLAGAGGTDHEDVVAACARHLQRSLCRLLSANVLKSDPVLRTGDQCLLGPDPHRFSTIGVIDQSH